MSDELEFERPGREMDDWEYPASEDQDEDESLTVPCPECGAHVYEDAVRCPHCGAYITPGAPSSYGLPAWWIVLGIVGALVAVLLLALNPPW